MLLNPATRGSPGDAGVCVAPTAAKVTAPRSGTPMATEREKRRMFMTLAPVSGGYSNLARPAGSRRAHHDE